MSIAGLIYDIQGYSVHDGPGIRTTVFLKGCPLHCPWCHSPESQDFHPQICYKKSSCLGADNCGKCLLACPNNAISIIEDDQLDAETGQLEKIHHVHIDRDFCNDCGLCASACSASALYVCGKEWTVEDAVRRVCKDRHFYEASGGGITLSGGEPLSQPAFATAFLKACKDEGLNTALDTTGFVPSNAISDIAPYVDLFLFDLKHMDSDALKRATGVPAEPIIENARLIAHLGGKIQVRIPVVPRFNDTITNMEATADFCAELDDAVTLVQLLPYHTLGLAKYERLQLKEKAFVATPMSDEDVEDLKEPFIARGIDVVIH